MSHPLSSFLDDTVIFKNYENSLKEFSKVFYQIIIDTDDFNTFEKTLTEWINIIDKNTESIFKLMQNHKHTKFWFSSIIGFFYQYGISCEISKNKALEMYMLAINVSDEKEPLNQN